MASSETKYTKEINIRRDSTWCALIWLSADMLNNVKSTLGPTIARDVVLGANSRPVTKISCASLSWYIRCAPQTYSVNTADTDSKQPRLVPAISPLHTTLYYQANEPHNRTYVNECMAVIFLYHFMQILWRCHCNSRSHLSDLQRNELHSQRTCKKSEWLHSTV